MKFPIPTLIAVAAAICVLVSSCFHHYYKATSPKEGAAVADSIISQMPHRFFILRSGNDAFAMSNIKLSANRKSLTCKLNSLLTEHQHHLGNKSQRYKIRTPQASVLNEVHLYVAPDNQTNTNAPYTLQLSDITKIEVLEKNKGRTVGSYVLGIAGLGAATIAVSALIVAATKSSCPFVSAYNGSDFSLQGEIFGGAIYPQLARNDYMQLELAPLQKNRLQIKISNELKERQFTDLARLMVVTHDKNVHMTVDQNGNLHTLSAPEPPVKAVAGSINILPLLNAGNDDKAFAFNDTAGTPGNEATLQFSNTGNAKKGKLILRLKNSYWLDFMYGKMTEAMGDYYPTFAKLQSERPAEDIKRWTGEQHIPLSLSVQTSTGWEPLTDITSTGPLAYREIVAPLSLPASGDVHIKLSTGFMFWEIDYAAIDFSENAAFTVHNITPEKAIDEAGKDVTHLLKQADGMYLEQPSIGNVVTIDYRSPAPQDPSKTQTYFLHAKGYYLHIRDYKNKPNVALLQQFRQPGGLSNYSMKVYKEAMLADLATFASSK